MACRTIYECNCFEHGLAVQGWDDEPDNPIMLTFWSMHRHWFGSKQFKEIMLDRATAKAYALAILEAVK